MDTLWCITQVVLIFFFQMDLNFCFECTSIPFENFDVFVLSPIFFLKKWQSSCACTISKVCYISIFDLVLVSADLAQLGCLIFSDSLQFLSLLFLDYGYHIQVL